MPQDPVVEVSGAVGSGEGEHPAEGLCALLAWAWVSLVHGTHSGPFIPEVEGANEW